MVTDQAEFDVLLSSLVNPILSSVSGSGFCSGCCNF